VDACDVAIVGGGPAGSSCAWRLRRAGLDVVVVDQAAFPRDKVCAGWITPPVVDALALDWDEYRRGRTFQPITGFGVGVIGGGEAVAASYARAVSFGIRRCEFDDYLLRRSGARLCLGARVATIRRDGAGWVVGEAVRAPMLVGAGGHFCPVAKMLNGAAPAAQQPARLVAAQETEVPVTDGACAVDPELPELFFAPDLTGYGWCFRKGGYVNIGYGRIGGGALPRLTADFVRFLRARRRVGMRGVVGHWRGHAYLVSGSPERHSVDDGVVLVGDAAGLAYPQSGEGIRPAVESGLLAADVILEADGDYRAGRLGRYARMLATRFGSGAVSRLLGRLLPPGLPVALGPRLLAQPWFVRHVVLDRWFLHTAG